MFLNRAQACTLRVQVGSGMSSLPTSWRLVWAYANDGQEVPSFIQQPAEGNEARVCEMRKGTDGAAIIAHVDTVVHCAEPGSKRARTAVYLIRVPDGASAKFRIVPEPVELT